MPTYSGFQLSAANTFSNCCCTTPMNLSTTKTLTGPTPILGVAGSDIQAYAMTVDNTVGVADGFLLQDGFLPTANVVPINPLTLTYSGGAAGPATTTWAALSVGIVIPTMPIGGHIDIAGSLQFVTAGAVSNTITAAPSSVHTDTDLGDNTASVSSSPVAPQANLSVSKVAAPSTVFQGDGGTWQITFANAGPDAANSSIVSDTLPAGATYTTVNFSYSGGAAGPASATPAAFAAGVTIPTFPNGGSVLAVVAYTAMTAGNKTNTAEVIPPATVDDPSMANNTSTAVVTVLPPPPQVNLVIDKTVSNPAPPSGVPFSYTITVTNNGPDAADGATVSDSLNWTLPNASNGMIATASPEPITYSGGAAGPADVNINFGDNTPPNAPFPPFIVTTFPAGGSLTFQINIEYSSNPSGRVFTNTAFVAPPAGVQETNAADNSKGVSHGVGASAPSPPPVLPGSGCPSPDVSTAQSAPFLASNTGFLSIMPAQYMGSVTQGADQSISKNNILSPSCREASNGSRVDVFIPTSSGNFQQSFTVSDPTSYLTYTAPTQAQITTAGFGTIAGTIEFTFRTCFRCDDGGEGQSGAVYTFALVP